MPQQTQQQDYQQQDSQHQQIPQTQSPADHSNPYQVKRSNDQIQGQDYQQQNNHFKDNDQVEGGVDIELKDDITPIDNVSLLQDSVSQSRIEQEIDLNNKDDQDKLAINVQDLDHEEVIDPKYGDQKIDLSELHQQFDSSTVGGPFVNDPSRPQNINLDKLDPSQPLPSYSNKVNIGEFSVGNFKEFQLREDLGKLIEKYNKQFYGDSRKPAIQQSQTAQEIRDTKYKEKMIINPIAVPQPGASSDNFSWMCLMTPYHNQLVKEFNSQQLENNILHQHYEYYLEMEKEKELLNQEFNLLRQAERKLQDQVESQQLDNQTLEDKVEYMDRNLHVVHPEKFREMNEKVENLSNVLKSKDNVIDQLLNEIALIKNEKDDLQNDVLFKKQRIENLNFEFNTKELEYQRLWDEEQNLKADIRGDTNQAKDQQRENEMLLREIALIRDEIAQNQAIYEQRQLAIQDQRTKVGDYEDRLRYGNEVIMQLESEAQSIQLGIAQQRAYVDSHSKAYNELKHNFQLLSTQNFQDGQFQAQSHPIISIPKMVNPSSYYKPQVTTTKATINLLPSQSKAMSQQIVSPNIKSYLSVKKTVIDLTSDIGSGNRAASRDQKVRFSMQQQQNEPSSPGPQNFPTRSSMQLQKRSDSLDARFDKKSFKQSLLNDNSDNYNHNQYDQQQQQRSPSHVRTSNFTRTQLGEGGSRVQSVNRNFIDTMGSLLGGGTTSTMNDSINMRASVQSNNVNAYPMKKVDISNVGNNFNSPLKSSMKDSFMRDSPPNNRNDRYRDMPTDVSMNASTRYDDHDAQFRGSMMSTQTPYRNKAQSSRGGPGHRNSQPQQLSNVKQRQQQPQSARQNAYHFGRDKQEFQEGSSWQDRMSELPRNSAYKSSLTFGVDGITIKDDANKHSNNLVQFQSNGYSQPLQQSHSSPFKMARDHDYDVQGMNEDDPQAKAQILKFKQQKVYELSDQRKLLQSQISHIPENSKQIAQRNKRVELDSEIQKITKRISTLKYDLKKLTCKDEE